MLLPVYSTSPPRRGRVGHILWILTTSAWRVGESCTWGWLVQGFSVEI